ncbi:uncharacterized protein LOC122384562 [Amphibalanus amphitrite]|uniref:uncharacterized protein LOC122384562 n=1 Tax=Amphibalanus amphitrite TaxID=1232801 RepID=UPI001C9046FB|nr:uncharacterized protein LOC122384562 [Amphibalanus amphitrite]
MGLLAALTVLLLASAAPAPAAAQSTLYPGSSCRITAGTVEPNVTCTCGQRLRQTPDSPPIDQLTIVGCLASGQDNPVERLTFLPADRRADVFDFVLTQVRAVNVSQSTLRLEATRGRAGAADHPLRRLHIALGELSGGLPDGALQGLGNLRTVSLDKLHVGRAVRSALSDLPRLRELSITESSIELINSGVVARVPRLRRIRFHGSTFSFIAADAFVIENDNDDDVEGSGSTCDAGDDASFLEFTNMKVNTMSTNGLRVGSVRRLRADGTSVLTMYAGALNVSLHAPADCRPLARFTSNSVTDMRPDALALENEAARPALLELGGNRLLSTALSPDELRLRGAFERRPLAGLPADRFDCTCCECPSTRRLIELALRPQQPSPIERDVFVAALGQALCVGDAADSFLQFASGCAPDSGLRARVSALVPVPSAAAVCRSSSGAALALPLLLAALRRG